MESHGDEQSSKLSNETDEISLWECLHDANLERVNLDTAQQTLRLDFDILYIREFHNLPESRFLLHFSGVESVRIYENDKDGDVAWPDFAQMLGPEKDGVEVFEATLSKGPADSLALRLFLHVNDNFYPNFLVVAKKLDISLTTGESLTIAEFIKLGGVYWDDFAERGRRIRAAAHPQE